jgi:hypothetical protein
MASPVVTIPTTGTDPKVATKGGAETSINDALQILYDDIQAKVGSDVLGTAATAAIEDFATPEQGAKADAAVQPADLGTAATAAIEDFATPEQGAKADALEEQASIVLYSTEYLGRIATDATGRIIEVEIFVFSNIYSGVIYLDGLGRDVSGGNGDDGAVSESLEWYEGSDYEDDGSLWIPKRDQVIDLIASYGQSYTLGDVATPVSTTAEHPGTALMMSAALPMGAPPATAFTDIVAPSDAEPPIVSAVNKIVSLLEADFTEVHKIVGAAVGEGGQLYKNIKKGDAVWTGFQNVLRDFKRLAEAEGLRPVMRGVVVCWGESDARVIPPWRAETQIRQLRQDLEDEAKAILGQEETVRMVVYSPTRAEHGENKPTSWGAAIRTVELSEPHLFTISGAAYGVEHDVDSHPTADGYRQLGSKMGAALTRVMYGTGWRSCDVLEAYWLTTTSVSINVHCPDSGTLVRDESNTQVHYPTDPLDPYYIGPASGSDAHDGGWWCEDKDGAIGVESAVVSGSNITLSLSRAGHIGTTKLLYAMRRLSTGDAGTFETMARGIFRSSSSITVNGEAVYDWLIPQYITL